MLLLASAVKLIAEIALLAMVGQWVLGMLAGSRRDENLFYRLLQVMTAPFVKVARVLTPRFVLDRHVPLAAFLLMLAIWVVATITKIELCMRIGVAACR